MTYPIDYGDEMLDMVRQLHAGDEELPGYDGWLADHMGGRVQTFREILLPQVRFFTGLLDRHLLDFGCGTGSTTVALAENSGSSPITALDIDAQSLDIARKRFRHHGIDSRVDIQQISPVQRVGDLDFDDEEFDFILVNGVLEHVVPFSTRPAVIREIWRLLKEGGCVFISETPNLLWPVDRHTTGLPLIPWLPSTWAHRLAVSLGRHSESSDLDVRGRRGMSFWEIVRPLKQQGDAFEVLNLTKAGNRLVPVPLASRRWKRRLGELLLERGVGPVLSLAGVPSLALGPFIEFLCLKKLPAEGT